MPADKKLKKATSCFSLPQAWHPLGGSRSGIRNGFRPARVEGEEVFGAAVEFHAAEAHGVEAGFHIDHAALTRFRYSMRL
jgi:hypothetical protein